MQEFWYKNVGYLDKTIRKQNYSFKVSELDEAKLSLHGVNNDNDIREIVKLIQSYNMLCKLKIHSFSDEHNGELLLQLFNALKSFKQLKKLSLEQGSFSRADVIEALGDLLTSNSPIKKLSIDHCPQKLKSDDNSVYVKLASYLPRTHLQKLVLTNNRLNTADGIAILKGAKQHQQPLALNLCHNDIGGAALQHVINDPGPWQDFKKTFSLVGASVKTVMLGPMICFRDEFREELNRSFEETYKCKPPENDYNVVAHLRSQVQYVKPYYDLGYKVVNEVSALGLKGEQGLLKPLRDQLTYIEKNPSILQNGQPLQTSSDFNYENTTRQAAPPKPGAKKEGSGKSKFLNPSPGKGTSKEDTPLLGKSNTDSSTRSKNTIF